MNRDRSRLRHLERSWVKPGTSKMGNPAARANPDQRLDHSAVQVHQVRMRTEQATRVRPRPILKPNPKAAAPAPLVLDGDGLDLRSLKLDGAELAPALYLADTDRLTIAQPPQRPFRLEIETVLDPCANTRLMGLYRSGATYCTQCEAEGFRRITYFPDRPDVMAVYTTSVEAEAADAPVLLANGNLIASGPVAGTSRHFATWHDPFPKPSYLFALVGGRLGCVADSFRT